MSVTLLDSQTFLESQVMFRQLRRLAKLEAERSVGKAVQQIGGKKVEKDDFQAVSEVIGRPPYALSYGEIRQLKKALDQKLIKLSAMAPMVRLYEEQLMAWILEEDRSMNESQLRAKACVLMGYVAYLFTPTVGWLGSYSLAFNAVSALADRFSNDVHREIVGAGNDGKTIETRFLFLGPLHASLTANYPQSECDALDELKLAGLASALISKVGSWGEIAPCLAQQVGLLIVVAGLRSPIQLALARKRASKVYEFGRVALFDDYARSMNEEIASEND